MQSTRETRALAYDILSYWERFNHHDQVVWVGAEYDEIDDFLSTANVGGVDVNVCNTSMCAAGTAVFLAEPLNVFKDLIRAENDAAWEQHAGALLGLDADEAYAIFYSDEKSAKRLMLAIASGKQSKWDKAMEKRESL